MAPRRKSPSPESSSSDREDRLLAAMEAMQATVQAMAASIATLQARSTPSEDEVLVWDPSPLRQALHVEGRDQAFDDFCKKKPREFTGLEKTAEVEDWLLDMEQLFDALSTPEEKQVKCAAFFLRGSTRKWWRSLPEAADRGLGWIVF